MLQSLLIKVVTSLATSLFTLLGKWLIDWVGTLKDNREIDNALEQEDRRRAASDLDIIFN